MTSAQTNDMEAFRESLRRHSMKATPQRLAVHGAMMSLGHASADMVAREISSRGGTRVTVASVYNILSSLSDIGIYRRRMSSTNKMFFDVNTFPHAHMYDCENDVYKDVVDDELMAILESHLAGKKFRGYRVEGIDLQIVVRPSAKKKRV